MKITPLYDRVVVKRIKPEDTLQRGIVIPDVAKDKPQEGEVLAIGRGTRLKDGTILPVDVKVGDRVLFGKYSGGEVKLDGEEVLILQEHEIFGVFESTESTKRSAKA